MVKRRLIFMYAFFCSVLKNKDEVYPIHGFLH
jgi:hypothetical protein